MSKFIEGQKYAGEQYYGGCGCMDTRSITIVKRDDTSIEFEEKFGNTTVNTGRATIETVSNWGEYIDTGDDRFFAYAEYV